MKQSVILIIVVAMAAFLFAQCRKSEDHSESRIYQGVVLYNVCGNVVIQTQGPDYLGQDNWKDENNSSNPVYDHVFHVSNSCEFGTYSQGDTINFVLTAQKPQQCAACLLYVAVPEVAYPIRVIK
jgi:hypothetical protein